MTSRRDIYERLRYGPLDHMRPADLVAVLDDLAAAVRNTRAATWRRHDVHPAALALRDALASALDDIEPWGEYDTLRAEAREMRPGLLAYVVHLLRAQMSAGRPATNPLTLPAYEHELNAQDQQRPI